MRFLFLLASLAVLFSCSSDHEQHSPDYTDAMAHEHRDDAPVSNVSSDYEPAQAVVTSTVQYGEIGDQPLNGFMAEPEASQGDDSIPSVILIHEWWGLNENIQTMTRRLAGEGYRVLAVDFYGGEVAADMENAQRLMRAAMSDFDAGLGNLELAADFLAAHSSGSVGIMGWCFGGAWTLNAAINLSDKLDAGVIYYGRVNTDPEELANIDIPLLGIFGEEDGGIPVEGVREFESVLNDLGKDADIHIYEGADHAFANPSGNRYKPEAAADAWEKTLEFLNNRLR
ncbi:MAG: dienelactone hydrolase family protein [Balneolia bacterium]|nr:dienelactone hydrolase family protein [Balneolia bacterium]